MPRRPERECPEAACRHERAVDNLRAVMLAMRPVPPSSPNAVPRTCEREGERRVKGGCREGVETPNRPLRRAAHRRVEGLRSPECREWTPGKVTASTQSGPFANALNTDMKNAWFGALGRGMYQGRVAVGWGLGGES